MATAYLTPGVYVEEVDRGPKPIEGVGTAVAAFLGVAEKGPIGEATMVANWTQFTDMFGGFVPGAYMAQARVRLLQQRRYALLRRARGR